MTTMTEQTMTLTDGRTLGYDIIGDPAGRSVFFFHGTPGSRLCLVADEWPAKIPGVKLIMTDRPGYGLSTPKPDRTLLGWAHDVAQLADHLGIDTFDVSGGSGGGPHALACAYRLPERVNKAVVTCCPSPANFKGATDGMSRGNRSGIFFGRYMPWLLRPVMRSYVKKFFKDPEAFLAAGLKELPAPDQESLKDPEVRAAIIRDIREAYRQGGDAQRIDGAVAMTSREWGFSLRDIKVPVFAWHGEDDVLVTKNMARHLEQEIPNCTLRMVPNAGHLLTEVPSVIEEVTRVLETGS